MPKEKVWVVDDEEDIQKLGRHHLSGESYQVIGAATGAKAVEKAQFKNPDLMILDRMLPSMGGLEGTRNLKK